MSFETTLRSHFVSSEGHPQHGVWLNYALTTNKRGEELVAKLRHWVPDYQGRRTLDVGSGYGGTAISMARAGAEAVGVEVDPKLLALSKSNAADDPKLAVKLIGADVMKWETLSTLGQFDVVTCDNVIEHVPVPQVAIAHIKRLLKPGGVVWLTAPNAFSFGQIESDCHYGRFGVSLLDPIDGSAYVAAALNDPNYDVSAYFTFDGYQSLFKRFGLESALLNPVRAADEEIAELRQKRARLLQQREVAAVPAALRSKLHRLLDEYLARVDADLAYFDALGPGHEREEFGHRLFREYCTELWYFVLSPDANVLAPKAPVSEPAAPAVVETPKRTLPALPPLPQLPRALLDATRTVRQRVKPEAAKAVRRAGTWALDRLGQYVVRNGALPGWVTEPGARGEPDARVRAKSDEAIDAYIAAHPDDVYAKTAAQIDRLRYARSLEWLGGVLRPRDRVLELGGGGMFSAILKHAYPDIELSSSNFELRTPFPLPDQAYDVVLCMETIEHVCDPNYLHATTLSGVKNCLSEAKRVLAPGGTMFLTTPNAAAAFVMHRALQHEPPWNWEYHFREFTLFEMLKLVQEAGFEVIKQDTVNAWNTFGTAKMLLGYAWLTGASVHGRGDNIFLVARRNA